MGKKIRKIATRSVIGLCGKTVLSGSGEDHGFCGLNAVALWDWGGEYLPLCYSHDKELRDAEEEFTSAIYYG